MHCNTLSCGKRWLLIVLAILVIGGVTAWATGVKRHIFPRHWETVETGMIYRSGELSTTLVKRTWEKHNIQCVINLLGEDGDCPKNNAAAAEAAQELGIERKFFPLIGDGTGDVRQYVLAIKALAEARQQEKPVVVHCAAGTYRTGGVIACYRVFVQGWSAEEAYREMLAEGVKPGPNTPILVYLNNNIAAIAQGLVDEGVIEKVPDPLPVFGR